MAVVHTGAAAAQDWLRSADTRALARRARTENFPVASLLLPASARPGVAAVYAVARLIDEAGDAAPGDRLAILDALETDLRREVAVTPALRALPRDLPREPFVDLIGANRLDQRKTRYADRAELRDYCRLSAEPVGVLVLTLLGLATPERLAWSADICAGLQLAEHLQDVGEDLEAGRVYLPLDALERHGVSVADLAGRTNTAAVSALLAGQVDWGRTLLAPGRALVASVPGRAKLAVAGFVAGGHAALDAVLAAGADAVWSSPRPRRSRFAVHLVGGLR